MRWNAAYCICEMRMRQIRWFDFIWVPIWVASLAFLGSLSTQLMAEGFVNNAQSFAYAFAAVLIIPPIVRSLRWITIGLRGRRLKEVE
jgi:hypothetical protein